MSLYFLLQACLTKVCGCIGSGGKVLNLSINGSISVLEYFGGVVGTNFGEVTNCSFSDSVSCNKDVGGSGTVAATNEAYDSDANMKANEFVTTLNTPAQTVGMWKKVQPTQSSIVNHR